MKKNKYHGHDIEFVNWWSRQGPPHRHPYSTETSFDNGHTHLMRGITSIASGGLDNHVHYYEGTTSFRDGHVHYYRGMTGPAIPLPEGGHIHEFEGQTTFNDGHIHYYRGRTGKGY